MNNLLTGILILISLTTFAQSDAELVRKTFSNYKKFILEGKGVEAAKWVDNKTISFYDKMLNMSLYADSASVQDLGIIDKLTVLSVRHRVPVEELLPMNGRDFFAYAIDHGMVGKNSVMTIEIGEVKVEGNFANGQMVSNGQKSPLYFQFNKEEGEWKLDITSLFPASNAGLKQMIESEEMTDNEFIFQTLEMLTGKTVSESIWQPLKKR